MRAQLTRHVDVENVVAVTVEIDGQDESSESSRDDEFIRKRLSSGSSLDIEDDLRDCEY